jgi:glycosyltransferase involved in cell wall biosynthesis
MEQNLETNAYYVPLIVDEHKLKNNSRTPSDALRILCVAKLDLPRKRHDVLFEAVKLLREEIPLHVTLVGSLITKENTYYQSIKTQIRTLGLERIVTVLENVPYQNMAELYRNHELFVLPSEKEPFSISPIEAMSYGLAPIIRADNGMRGLITNDENGIVVPNSEPAKWAESIIQFQNKELLRTMSYAAYAFVNTELSEEKFVGCFKKVISAA